MEKLCACGRTQLVTMEEAVEGGLRYGKRVSQLVMVLHDLIKLGVLDGSGLRMVVVEAGDHLEYLGVTVCDSHLRRSVLQAAIRQAPHRVADAHPAAAMAAALA